MASACLISRRSIFSQSASHEHSSASLPISLPRLPTDISSTPPSIFSFRPTSTRSPLPATCDLSLPPRMMLSLAVDSAAPLSLALDSLYLRRCTGGRDRGKDKRRRVTWSLSLCSKSRAKGNQGKKGSLAQGAGRTRQIATSLTPSAATPSSCRKCSFSVPFVALTALLQQVPSFACCCRCCFAQSPLSFPQHPSRELSACYRGLCHCIYRLDFDRRPS